MRLIIIGAGPGGYETAAEAAAKGIETILISDGPLGGTCLNEGCIPTKTLCAMSAPDQERKDAVISQLQAGIAQLLKASGVSVVQGRATFAGAHSVKVGDDVYEADAVIVATGSVSASLPIPGAGLTVDSTAMLGLKEVPQRLCVIGGGVIGLEFASVYARFGSEVTVLEFCPGVLPRFDADLAKRLKAALSKRGIKIETSAQVTSVEEVEGARRVHWLKGPDKEFTVDADCVLMAVGRRANVGSVGLDAAGIEYTPRGIKVDEFMQTNVPGVYAIGDVTGGMMLAHVASAQGRVALAHICGEPCGIDLSLVPAAVFTVPEVATVGLTEEECEGREVVVGKANYRANGKAVASGEADGYCKVIADRTTGKLLGAHILGAHASDLIHEAAVLIALGATAAQARDIIHAHPTLSEILRDALSAAAKSIS